MLLHLCVILNIGLCTVFANVHSLSFYIGWAEVREVVRPVLGELKPSNVSHQDSRITAKEFSS